MTDVFDVKNLVDSVSSLLKMGDKPIGLHQPSFRGNEWKYLKDCLDTGWVSSVGKYVDQFEQELAKFVGVKHAVAVVNGTAALHVCLLLSEVKANDEILVPALTFVATANAIKYCNAIPHFVDSDFKSLGVDPAKLGSYLESISDMRSDGCYNKKTGRRIRALLPVHTFGHPVDLEPLVEIAKRFKLILIEDAAESLGSLYKNHHTGTYGQVSATSFNGNKIMTTGGGGAVLTNDSSVAKLAKHMTTTAKLPHQWAFTHDRVGYNYRLPNINAALGCAQLEQLPHFIEQKRHLADAYRKTLSSIKGVQFFVEPEYARSNYWLNTLILNSSTFAERDLLLEAFHSKNIQARPAWQLMHTLSMYADCPRMDLTQAQQLELKIVNVPSSSFLRENDV